MERVEVAGRSGAFLARLLLDRVEGGEDVGISRGSESGSGLPISLAPSSASPMCRGVSLECRSASERWRLAIVLVSRLDGIDGAE